LTAAGGDEFIGKITSPNCSRRLPTATFLLAFSDDHVSLGTPFIL
jgi:hypothetical protein